MDFRAINFEAVEFIYEQSVRQFPQLVNAVGSPARQFGQRNRPRGLIAGVFEGANVDPLAELFCEFEQRLRRTKMRGRNVVEGDCAAHLNGAFHDHPHRLGKRAVDVDNCNGVTKGERLPDFRPRCRVVRQSAVHERDGRTLEKDCR